MKKPPVFPKYYSPMAALSAEAQNIIDQGAAADIGDANPYDGTPILGELWKGGYISTFAFANGQAMQRRGLQLLDNPFIQETEQTLSSLIANQAWVQGWQQQAAETQALEPETQA